MVMAQTMVITDMANTVDIITIAASIALITIAMAIIITLQPLTVIHQTTTQSLQTIVMVKTAALLTNINTISTVTRRESMAPFVMTATEKPILSPVVAM
jgi:hypothetical protein